MRDGGTGALCAREQGRGDEFQAVRTESRVQPLMTSRAPEPGWLHPLRRDRLQGRVCPCACVCVCACARLHMLTLLHVPCTITHRHIAHIHATYRVHRHLHTHPLTQSIY